MVVDLAVEDDPGVLVGGRHGLAAGGRQVEHGESPGTQAEFETNMSPIDGIAGGSERSGDRRGAVVAEHDRTAVIGTAVVQKLGHVGEPTGGAVVVLFQDQSGDATHGGGFYSIRIFLIR